MGYSIFKPYRGIDESFQGVLSFDFLGGFGIFFRISKEFFAPQTTSISCFPGSFSKKSLIIL